MFILPTGQMQRINMQFLSIKRYQLHTHMNILAVTYLQEMTDPLLLVLAPVLLSLPMQYRCEYFNADREPLDNCVSLATNNFYNEAKKKRS